MNYHQSHSKKIAAEKARGAGSIFEVLKRFAIYPLLFLFMAINFAIIGGGLVAAAAVFLLNGDKLTLILGVHVGWLAAAFTISYVQNVRWPIVSPKVLAALAMVYTLAACVAFACGIAFSFHRLLLVLAFQLLLSLSAFVGGRLALRFRDGEIARLGGEDWHKVQVPFFPRGLITFLSGGIGNWAMLLLTCFVFASAMTQTEVGAPLNESAIIGIQCIDAEGKDFNVKQTGRFWVVTLFNSSNKESYEDLKKISHWDDTFQQNTNINFLLIDMARTPKRARSLLSEHQIEVDLCYGYLAQGHWTSTYPDAPATWIIDLDTEICLAAALRGNQIDQALQNAADNIEHLEKRGPRLETYQASENDVAESQTSQTKPSTEPNEVNSFRMSPTHL